MQKNLITLALFAAVFTASCSYNPFTTENQTTGSIYGAAGGAAIGGTAAAIFDSSKPIIGLSALAGGAIGYYVTTLRYDSGGVMMAGGQVYKVGNFIGIYIPNDQLFEPHSADFLPQAGPILDSASTVLMRYPDNNILISGNTSGFYRPRFEQKLSQMQAEKVAAYLWRNGISNADSMGKRRLQYSGYGDFFPIANTLHNKGIRANSHIQITSYPSNYALLSGEDAYHGALYNVGSLDDDGTIVDCGPKRERC